MKKKRKLVLTAPKGCWWEKGEGVALLRCEPGKKPSDEFVPAYESYAVPVHEDVKFKVED